MAATMMMFGSHVSNIELCKALPRLACGTTRSGGPPANPVTYKGLGARLVANHEQQVKDCFSDLEAHCAKRVTALKAGRVIATKRAFIFKEFGKQHQRNLKRAEVRLNELFEAGSDNTKHINVDESPRDGVQGPVSFRSPYWRRSVKTQKPVIKERILKLSDDQVQNITRALIKICKANDSVLQIVEKRKRPDVFTHPLIQDRKSCRVHLWHLEKKLKRTDVRLTEFSTKHVLPYVGLNFEVLKRNRFQPGDCGLVIRRDTVPLIMRDSGDDFFIVRGKYKDQYIDARETLSRKQLLRINQYSADSKFWAGYDKKFGQHRPKDIGHTCESNFNVEECGQIAALLTQAIYPCGRITCLQCAQDYAKVDDVDLHEWIQKRRSPDCVKELLQKTSFPHLEKVINLTTLNQTSALTNTTTFEKIHTMVGSITEMPFKQLNDLNSLLLKMGTDHRQEYVLAVEALFDVVKYIKNRTDSIARSELTHFRNKRSAKTHFNADLMCDNQLDKNGNFLWGLRGYHAKRFFSNYFEKVVPSEGYDKFVTRRSPNCTRQLAISKLIVSTNFDTFRQQMQGESVEVMPVTKECVGTRRGNFLYPCCCVTHDDGTPALSEFVLPTKHHLVLGNTGDAKYVELPTDENQTMYIAKEGYCYINIFFSMLINVSEDDALKFTKMVRDTMVPRLKQWPSMMDVATACYMLTIFFPDTASAELPRILVDHKSKTMHVLDSYGSVTTGYHILKANTIRQLIDFADGQLESEMKHYQVGGFKAADSIHLNVKWLIKGIYDPDFMRRIIEEEPFVLLLALVSPSVLLALFNSGSLEIATKHWINRRQTIAEIMTMLSLLAGRVSCARAITRRFEIIHDAAGELLAATDRTFEPYHSIYAAQVLLGQMIESKTTDDALRNNGFETMRVAAQEWSEKSYQQDLQDAWSGLGLFAKFSLIMRSKRLQREYATLHPLGEASDSIVKVTTSFRASLECLGSCTKAKIIKGRRKLTNKVYEFTGRSVCGLLKLYTRHMPDMLSIASTLSLFMCLVAIVKQVNLYIQEHKALKDFRADKECEEVWKQIYYLYYKLKDKLGTEPTEEEFSEYLRAVDIRLAKVFETSASTIGLKFQAKSKEETQLERIMAVITLILMVFDAERSDCVYKILNKLRNLVGIVETDRMRFQSLDDVSDLLGEKRLTVDFEIANERGESSVIMERTFGQWWNHQLTRNATVPHYRTEGSFIEFTRSNAAEVASSIAHGDARDILIRGAVGSGKSTALPFHLSSKGFVLLIEPTRPLAENVYKQLKREPFNCNPSLRMRGNTCYGSSPIAVMTSGYALHFYAHNPSKLGELDFVIIDECHVQDANAMAFRCLLHEYSYKGRVIKASATPPGREVTFTTQHKVEIKSESSMSFEQFVSSQGTGANADATVYGNNILVYVASYNEVDQLSSLLLKAGYKVTKIDGRTMKGGGTEIVTSGTDQKKHFIVATNIIENGVTLDIEVVVDFGLKVVAEIDCEARAIRYDKKSISYGERIQRCGRVGRHKMGCAIKIGDTEKGMHRISSMIATEAAFLCFAYGLPVMTDGVSTSILENCTVQQAKTMLHFELPIFVTSQLVRFDGSMHPEIHKVLTQYKLRDSEIILNKMAIPSQAVSYWKSVREMAMHGCRLNLEDNVLIPFYSKEVPSALYEKIHHIVREHKGDAGFGRISSYSAARIAYTLQTDGSSIQRTVYILDKLIEGEMIKRDHFANATSVTLCSKNWSLSSLVASIRSRHMSDHTAENISVLQAVKAQLLEFKNVQQDLTRIAEMENSGALECMLFQSEEAMSDHLGLKGHWNKSLITMDVIILIATAVGGSWMVYEHFMEKVNEPMQFQGRGKRERQKLKFRAARDNKHAYEVHGEDADIRHYFGDAYSKKGKGKGTTVGMGAKTRKFVNMYSFDPTEYSFARYVDPLTGHTLDEQVVTDIQLVQDHFGNIRRQFIDDDLIDPTKRSEGIQAYFVKNLGKQVLKVDLTPHNPLRVCDKHETIAGFPEREHELRQTGIPQMLSATELPPANEFTAGSFEGRTTFSGMRDYNPIAQSVCHLENDSNGLCQKLFGIGYGSVIITNQHLFKNNNGTLRVKTHHGEYIVPNTTSLNMYPVDGCDILVIQMPKDFVPFPRRLRFRQTKPGERVCMVGSNFQTKSISSVVSESSATARVNSSNFYKHWISTKDGQCGNPIVSPKDGYIVGIHSLASIVSDMNMYTGFLDSFESEIIGKLDVLDWTKKWKLNLERANWGPINILSDTPQDSCFKLTKTIHDLADDLLKFQSVEGWLRSRLEGNLKAMAKTQNALVTKHVVKGKCQLFSTYLECNKEASDFFRPLMGAYDKSRLNKEAYIKDFTKYAAPITVGLVDVEAFENSFDSIITMFEESGFTQCEYITDDETIFQALNMKAAVGALYSGKKKDYFNGLLEEEKQRIIQASCERLYNCQMGVWNGSLKAELRPKEKVVLNKTRSFTAAPIDTLLGGKVCVDDFNNKFYAHHFKLPSSVGMTKFYGGWDELLKLMPQGWTYCDADGSQFDSSLSPYLINAVLNLRLHFMEDWDLGEQMLRNLYTEIIYTPIAAPDGTIVKKHKGNNSGQPSTVVDNTIMVMMAVHYSLVKSGVKDIRAVCRYVVNGDDLMIAVAPGYETLLDSMAQDFQQLGLNYNFDSRSMDIKDLWFMSHKGVERDGLMIPKLEMERIVSILEWDRAELPEHRLEAICAAMIEAWGYDDLLRHIRKFYSWVLEQAPYHDLSEIGKAPYISEVALKALYTGVKAQGSELAIYTKIFSQVGLVDSDEPMKFQSGGTIDAGEEERKRTEKQKQDEQKQLAESGDTTLQAGKSGVKDRDIDASTIGTFSVPKLKNLSSKMSLPRVGLNTVVNLDHLLIYKPDQSRISNTRATDQQFRSWFQGVQAAYELSQEEMRIVMNGLMVWCIENGTSPNINGMWVMMDGDEQVEYPIKPLIDHARPTFRQIMAHFSPLAEAYIEKQNTERAYMPRYGLQRNLTDMSLARYAFDFYEMNSRTPVRAREAHLQMKAAAIRNAHNRLFGLDGNVGTTEEDTERHTANDVRRNMHHLMGAQL